MPLIIGIDVGGTNTDAVLVSEAGVLKKAKVPTDHENLLESVLSALSKVYDDDLKSKLQRICLSTTLTTNSIVQEDYNKVGLLCIPGPGLPPEYLPFSENLEVLSGYIDHRGRVIKDISLKEVKRIVKSFLKKGIEYFAVVGKFSNRNSEFEIRIKNYIENTFPDVKHISLGHQIASRLNFPRRVATTYLNAAVYAKNKSFIEAVKNALLKKNITTPVFLLKADGGTIGLSDSLERCVDTILSGPAASIMGELALTKIPSTAVLIDIGGTTTDIALFLNGSPVFEPEGAEISGHKTSVRALFSRSIGIGGDSAVRVENGTIKIGPHREGPAVVFGGDTPTPTDAAAFLGYLPECSPETAKKALKPLAESLNLNLEETAKAILNEASLKIATSITNICNSLSNRPVYTVKEVLKPLIIKPEKVFGIGGPSRVLTPLVAEKLGIKWELSSVSEIANAVGAAIARPTTSVTLHCDTSVGFYNVPELGIREKADKKWDLEKVISLTKKLLEEKAKSLSGYEKIDLTEEIEITKSENFNVVKGFSTTGKVMEVEAQIKPAPLFFLEKSKDGGKNV